MVDAAHLAARQHDAGGAGHAGALVHVQRLGPIVVVRAQGFAQSHSVFHGHASALRHILRGGVRGVAQQGHAAIGPLANRLAVSGGPALPGLGQVDQLACFGANALKVALHFFFAAVRDAPFFLLAAVESHHHVVLLAATQRVVHQVAIGADPNRSGVPLQVFGKVFFVDHGAVHHMAGHAGRVAHKLLTHDRLHAIGADQGAALECLAVLVPHGHAVVVLLDAHHPRAGVERDLAGFLRAFEQGQMHIGPVDDGVRVAKALAKLFIGGNLADLVFVDRVVHDHVVGVDGAATGLVANAQSVKGVESVGAELDARTDLADLGGLLQHGDLKSLADQGEGGRQAADAATGNDDRKLSWRGAHGFSLDMRAQWVCAYDKYTY